MASQTTTWIGTTMTETGSKREQIRAELPPEASDQSALMKRNEWAVPRPLWTRRQLSSVPVYKWIWRSQQLGKTEHLDQKFYKGKVSALLQVVKGQQGAICTADLVTRENTGSCYNMKYNIYQTPEGNNVEALGLLIIGGFTFLCKRSICSCCRSVKRFCFNVK